MTTKRSFLPTAFVLFLLVFVGAVHLNDYLADTAKRAVETEFRTQLGLDLDAGVVTVDALRGDAVAHGLRLNRPYDVSSFVSVQKLTFDADPRSLFHDVVHVNSLDFSQMEAVVEMRSPMSPLIALARAEAQPAPEGSESGFRIDKVTFDADWIVVKHRTPTGATVDWRIQPMDIRTQDVRLPAPPDTPIEATLSATLLEPSTGSAQANVVLTPRANAWDVSCREDATIGQIAALNPYLTSDFPMLAESGSLSFESDTSLRGTSLESTIKVALLQPHFKPRERNLKAVFTGPLAGVAVKAIKDVSGDIRLDPITVQGDLNDPKFDPQAQILTEVRNQLLRKILRQGTDLPADVLRQMENSIASLGKVGIPAEVLLKGAGQVGEKALQTGSGLAEKTKDIGETAKKMTEGLQNLLPLGKKKEEEKN